MKSLHQLVSVVVYVKIAKFIPLVLVALAVLSGCSTDSPTGNNTMQTNSNTEPNCRAITAEPQGVQPEQTSIENLFGCVTFQHTSSDGESTFEDSVIFTADGEASPILGGRTVQGLSGRKPVQCAEITIGDADFICAVSGFTTNNVYVLTMDSQFEGSGTQQLCFQATGECGFDGVEFPKTAATMTIVRNQ